MPAGGFKTFTAGSVLTASDVNAYLMQGVLVFTNEAARDAAITSAVEGMVAYLTAPTVPAATGGSTSIPSGVVTVYNGSKWVCITSVGAATTNLGQTTSTSWTATLTGTPGTNPSVTLETGTTALVSISANMFCNTNADTSMGVAVSGATTLSPQTGQVAYTSLTNGVTVSNRFIVTGLTAGTNTFTFNYQSNATGNYQWRTMIVQGIA